MQEKPPSTVISDPVTKLAASEANQRIAPVNSLGLPNLCIAVWFKIAALRSLSIKFLRFHSVGKNPGLIEFTLTPLRAHSLARFCVKFVIAAFAAEYVKAFESGGPADAEEILIIKL